MKKVLTNQRILLTLSFSIDIQFKGQINKIIHLHKNRPCACSGVLSGDQPCQFGMNCLNCQGEKVSELLQMHFILTWLIA
jgi:hypothetical protein